jgi:hypothetical protein
VTYQKLEPHLFKRDYNTHESLWKAMT